MPYAIKEIFYSLQGEGLHTGRAAVFCRFSGCNLWTGKDKDRSTAICPFCDTDFLGTNGPKGGVYDAASSLVGVAKSLWPASANVQPFVVCTGGEPLLQLDSPLIKEFRKAGFFVAIETNGTMPVPEGIDWVCVSPKQGAKLVVHKGHELKLVFPQQGLDPATYEQFSFDYFLLQPQDGPNQKQNTEQAVQYCLEHPKWRLSLQTHKSLGIK